MLVLGALAPAYAVEERIINATELIISFSQLNNTDAGKNILSQNIATVISINNSSTEELRQQAIYDNTIAALFGSMSNGLLVSDALGETMSQIFAKNNSINENMYSASIFSSSFEKLLFEANTLTQENTTFAKNFYANGSIDGDLNNLATDITCLKMVFIIFMILLTNRIMNIKIQWGTLVQFKSLLIISKVLMV